MTYTPTQLEIIKVFGKKTLGEGCLIQQGEYLMQIWCIYEGICNMKEINSANCMQKKESDLCEILGHIPHLEDVFRVSEEKKIGIAIDNYSNINERYITIRKEKTDGKGIYHLIPYDQIISLLEQPESVLIELLNLFK